MSYLWTSPPPWDKWPDQLPLTRTMLDNDCNILGNMSKTDFREFRALMIEMVLHTGETALFSADMSKHLMQISLYFCYRQVDTFAADKSILLLQTCKYMCCRHVNTFFCRHVNTFAADMSILLLQTCQDFPAYKSILFF